MMAERPDDVSALTPVAQDYLKAIWSATEWGEGPLGSKTLAARYRTSPAAVTDTMRRLSAQGLVRYQPYRPVTLTERGRALAIAMVRRHRLLETFLVERLDYSWDEVHDEAERLEHAVSDTLLDRMDAALGYPTSDPHGDPIPTTEGELPDPGPTERMDEVGPGRYRVSRVSDADPARLTRLAGLGLLPDRVVRVLEATDVVRIRVADIESELSCADAATIRVRR